MLNWWEHLGRFWERSTGGRDVAANLAPGPESNWPTAPRAAGIDAAAEWLRRGLDHSDVPRFVFLVGGPGAGKSHAAASVVRDLKPLNQQDSLAARTYEYAMGEARLLVVNDATITSTRHGKGALAAELSEAVASLKNLMACVNRGILVEELASLRRQGVGQTDSAGAAILQWLHSSAQVPETWTRFGWSVERSGDQRDYLRGGRLFHGVDEIAEIVAVYADVNSLFEGSPKVLIESVGDLNIRSDPYKIAAFADHLRAETEISPAASLFNSVIDQIPPVAEDALLDPFAANVSSLKNDSIRRGVCSILRASEVVSSQRMTYREIWGALSRCVVGGATVQLNADELESFVLSKQPHEEDSIPQRFSKVQDLAEYRFSQALFGASGSVDELHRDPILRLTRLVDPVLDALPGNIAFADDLGWASPIADSFSGDRSNSSPLDALQDTGASEDPFSLVVTSFDRELDSAYVQLIHHGEVSEQARRDATSWYGAYLVRLFAVANGIPAFRREVSMWVSAWGLAPTIPSELEKELKTLLRPVRYPAKVNEFPLFPIFESRTNPIRGDLSGPKLGIRSEVGKIWCDTESDSLFVHVNGTNSESSRMLLDFAMVREAMACAYGYAGATELSDNTSPRLERFRAARLVPKNLRDATDYRIVSATDDKSVSIKATP